MDGIRGVMFWSSLVTALAYYLITIQLLIFVNNPKILEVFKNARDKRDYKERNMILLSAAVAILFASYMWLCGNTHIVSALRRLYPHNNSLILTEKVFMIVCAAISFISAMVCIPLFPALVEAVQSFELGLGGKIQHADSYLVEAVDLVKEGILVVSDKMVVLRASEASHNIFGPKVVGSSFPTFLHPDDQQIFNQEVVRVATSYNFTPSTVDVRISVLPPTPLRTAHHTPNSVSLTHRSARRGPASRVYATDDIESLDTTPNYPPPLVARRTAQLCAGEFKWIEITMCRGKQYAETEGYGYDLKMVCRDIDDQKKRQAHQLIADGTEEKSRANDVKMRYISCVAHDLKTPVQSFSFSLDLLVQTGLSPEQREYVQQANVAVDLMRLTISQTMDISKALAGAKLMPRRTTVYLSSVLNRVKIIINGYGKQVPVSFEVAPDVCDEIITDEEWLWQMLLNLLTNACKYTDRGSIHVRISVSQEQPLLGGETGTQKYAGVTPLQINNVSPDMLLCEVIDTGVGIHPDKLQQIFEAFSQVQEGQVTGTGLGLFGVRKRVEGLRGTCGARHNTESSTGTGTVLWFAIPYVPDATILTGNSRRSRSFNAASEDLALSPSISSEALNRGDNSTTVNHELAVFTEDVIRRLRLTAMVVEDTLTVRKLMQKLLLKMGFASVECYENGSRGLEAMMAAPVDIVFSDVQMPIMTGPEMVSRFRKWEADTLRATVQGNLLSAHAGSSGGINTINVGISGNRSAPGSVPQSPQARALSPTDARPSFSFPLHRGAQLALQALPLGAPIVRREEPLFTPVLLAPRSSMQPASRHVRTVRPRQLIVAVTANGAECGECGENGFDEICLKPLTKNEIYVIINRYFQ